MTEQERLFAIWRRSVEKMQEVVREFEITEDELHAAGDYFDRLGRAGMSRSLIDVALALTSVENRRASAGGTRSNLEGPYHAAHPHRKDGRLCDRDPGGDAPRLTLTGVVRWVGTGEPIPGAEIDAWQADHRGFYDRKGHHLRGIVVTDAHGAYRIETVLPSDYSEHDHDPVGELFRAMGRTNTRAAHVHIKINVEGRELLTTQLFMPTSRMLDQDYVEGAVSDDLIVPLERTVDASGTEHYSGRFDFSLVPIESPVDSVR